MDDDALFGMLLDRLQIETPSWATEFWQLRFNVYPWPGAARFSN